MAIECERVLVIDDDPEFLSSVGDCLEAEGVEVVLANDGDAAFQALAAGFRPDAILLDVVLGEGPPAEQVFAQMRQDPRTAGVPIAIMTGSPQFAARFRQADAVLRKPFDLQKLYRVLDSLCAA